jgi:hypothetical protein
MEKTSIRENAKMTSHAPLEGEMTKKIESYTARVPSLGYLGLALGSLAISAGLAVATRRKNMATFVGLWVPSFLLMGIYNKLVKLEGSDSRTPPENLH